MEHLQSASNPSMFADLQRKGRASLLPSTSCACTFRLETQSCFFCLKIRSRPSTSFSLAISYWQVKSPLFRQNRFAADNPTEWAAHQIQKDQCSVKVSSDITKEDADALSKVNQVCLVFYTAEATRLSLAEPEWHLGQEVVFDGAPSRVWNLPTKQHVCW